MRCLAMILFVLCVSVFCSHVALAEPNVVDKVSEIAVKAQDTAKLSNETVSIIMEKLEVMAVGLGTTAKYLWIVMVKQAYIVGITNLVYIVAIFGGVYVYYRYVMFACKNKWYGQDDSDATWLITIFGGIILVILSALSLFCFTPTTLTGLLNPEYWAFTEVLKELH